jgi:hypothetical protein
MRLNLLIGKNISYYGEDYLLNFTASENNWGDVNDSAPEFIFVC